MVFLLYDFGLIVGWHPFSILIELDSEEIVFVNSIRFSEKTSIRMMARFVQVVVASGLPTSER
jgi:hypothetical protein